MLQGFTVCMQRSGTNATCRQQNNMCFPAIAAFLVTTLLALFLVLYL